MAEHLEMEYETIFEVIDSWEHLRRIQDYELVAGTILFTKLFDKCPPAKVLFGFPLDMDPGCDMMKDSARFQKHAKYMIQMLDKALNLLGPDAELLEEILSRLGKLHARIGVQERFFPFMEESLLETLAQTLGTAFTPQVERNWKVVYAALSTSMITAMNSEKMVLESWAKLKKIENYDEIAGITLFQEMFRQCPDSKTLFGFPVDMDVDSSAVLRSRRFKNHAKYFIEMLDRALGMVQAKQLEEHLKDLGELHSEFGVKEEYFAVMGEALFLTLQKTLKDDWNTEVKSAWQDVYSRLSTQMIAAINASKKGKE